MSRWVISPHAALLTLSSLPNHRQSRLACSRPQLLRALTASYEPRYSTLRSYLTRSSRRQKRCWRSRRCVCVEQQKSPIFPPFCCLKNVTTSFRLLGSKRVARIFSTFCLKTCRAHIFHMLSQNVSRASFPHVVSKMCRARLFHILSQNVSRASFPHQAHPHILSGRGGAEVKELRRHLARYLPHDAHTPDAA